MTRKRRWFWFLLFVCVALLLGTLATGWNVVLVRNYWQMLELARNATTSVEAGRQRASLLYETLGGTLGFLALLGALVLFFLKVLKEMRLNQAQSEFLAAVSHELKTPIAAIDLSASLIRGGGLAPEEVESLWASHDRELRRLREEVNTLLEAARMEAHPERVRPAPVELEPWLSQALDRWRRMLGPDARLAREGEPLPLRARVDPKTLNLITDNLVDNARKFSKGAPELVVRTRRCDSLIWWPWPRRRQGWRIEFDDRGWGFDPSDSRRIFGPFFRARTPAPYAIPGSGLGLHLAATASRSMGLRLGAESHGKGRGARFTLEGRESRA